MNTDHEVSAREPLDQVAESFLARLRAGEQPAVSEYQRKYPELADDIGELFPALVMMEEGRKCVEQQPAAHPACLTDEQMPEKLGEYRLLRLVGRGGMGVVYEAWQDSLSRHVALKVLPFNNLVLPELLGRFRREACAAARLHHTNIVPVFGVGEDQGIHFYAMQFIHGQGLDAVLEEVRRLRGLAGEASTLRGLATTVAAEMLSARNVAVKVPDSQESGVRGQESGVRGQESGVGGQESASRLLTPDPCFLTPGAGSSLNLRQQDRYFASVALIGQQAAEALDYAHQQGVVHRDVKPSNLLLDTAGRVWITDFGLAKADDSEVLTHPGDIMGTVRYMAPERFRGQADQRSDIYSLGLTLYEMLTLRPAFTASERLQLIERIALEEPARPRKLDPCIPRDLETIVLKAMAKEPARRYATAGELAEDLRRFLADRPIRARRTPGHERVWRWCRRNPAVACLLTAVALLLVTIAAVATFAAVRLDTALTQTEDAELQARSRETEARLGWADAQKQKTKAEQAAAAEKAAAQKEKREREYAQAIADFVKNDFFALTSLEGQDRFGDPQQDRLGKDATLRELLDRAAAKLNQRRDLDPRIEADLRWMIGVNYRALGEYRRAVAFLERCVALRRELLGLDDEHTLAAQNSLAVAYNFAGQPNKAVPLGEETLRRRQINLGPDHLDTLNSMCNLASSYQAAGQVNKALPLFEEALRLIKTRRDHDHPRTLTYMGHLARGYHAARQLDKALPLYQETLRRMTARLGADHHETLNTMNNLAAGYQDARQLDKALPLYQEILRLRKAKLPPDHPDTLTSMNNLARGYQAAGQLDKALPLFEETLRLRKAKLPPDHPHTLVSMNNLAAAYQDARQLDKALPLYEESLSLQKAKLPPDHPDTLITMNNLASGYKAAGWLDKALPLYQETLRLRTAKLGPDHPDTLTTMNNLAWGYRAGSQLDRSLPLFEQAAIGVEKRGFQHEFADRIVPSFIGALEEAKNWPKAETWRRKWLAVVREESGASSGAYADELRRLGVNLLQQNKFTDAEPVLRDCLPIFTKTQPDAWTTFNTKSLLGAALLGQKKYSQAQSLLHQAYHGMKLRERTIPNHARVCLAETAERLVTLYQALDQPDEVKWWQGEKARVLKGKTP